MTAQRAWSGYAAAATPPPPYAVPGGHPTEVFGSYTTPEHSPAGFALDVGDDLSIWTITARVNAGVNAHVYRASDPEAVSGRDVALKVLLPQSAHGRQDLVVHEVAAMSSLTLGHPHLMSSTIARRINAGPYTGGVLIVMPWATLNLREYVLAIRRGDELPDDGRWARTTSMCEALSGIADGLAHLHALQTSHGDVKPDNIMLVDGVWKLGDFGLTRPMEGSYVLSAPGTLSYTAPEEARAQHADPAAEIKRRPAGDVWALGVTLHFAVTGGRFPMPGITPDERLAAVRQGVIQVSPEVQLPELRHLLAEQLLVDDLHRGPQSYERRTSAALAGEVLRRIAATEHLPTRRIRVDPVVDSDAMLRYRGQCERVAAQTVEQWRDLGPWDAARAATTMRSRGVLHTMVTNRLAALEPPPELRLRKSVLARTLGLRTPYETCRIAARENAVVRYAPPLEDSPRVARRLALLGVLLVSLTALATAGTANSGQTILGAALMAGVVALFAAVAVGGRFPEPAYVFGSRTGPLAGALAGLVLGLAAVSLLGGVLAGDRPQSAVAGLHDVLAVLPAGLAVGLLGWYGAGVVTTRHAVASQRRAANAPPPGSSHLPRPNPPPAGPARANRPPDPARVNLPPDPARNPSPVGSSWTTPPPSNSSWAGPPSAGLPWAGASRPSAPPAPARPVRPPVPRLPASGAGSEPRWGAGTTAPTDAAPPWRAGPSPDAAPRGPSSRQAEATPQWPVGQTPHRTEPLAPAPPASGWRLRRRRARRRTQGEAEGGGRSSLR